jgi:hypothetical protein
VAESGRRGDQGHVENIGTTAFNISKVQVSGLKFTTPALAGEESIKYLDVNVPLANTETVLEETYDEQSVARKKPIVPFVGHYPPKTAYTHTFQFVAKRDPAKWILLRIDFELKRQNEYAPDGTAWWGQICE